MKFSPLILLLLSSSVFSFDFQKHLNTLDERQIWQAPSGQMTIEFRPDILETFGVEVFHHGAPVTERGSVPIRIEPAGDLSFLAPFGNFERFHDGRLEITTGLEVRFGERRIDLNRATLVPKPFHGQPGLGLVDDQGRLLFNLTHFHVLAVPAENRLEIKNADLHPTEEFGQALGLSYYNAVWFGMAAMDLELDIPAGADVSQDGAPRCTTPVFPQDGKEANVELIRMDQISQMGAAGPDGQIKVTPSATLKGVGEADVPWVPKFGSIAEYTYEPRDQHPFLLWAMYRVHDGRIEMLGNSGAKHAWLTVNTNCPCSGGNILWPECEDVYGTGINDNGSDLGPRSDIEAHLGLHETCGSFFDPDCVGGQTNASDGAFENRMVVHPDDFIDDAEFYFDSWYVVQFDVDIWRTMGYRPVNPTSVSNGWSFDPGPFQSGPPLSEWVPEGRGDPLEAHQVIEVPSLTPDEPYPDNMPQGHLRVLVKVHELDGGLYRYNYAVMNYDFDRGVRSFSIPLAEGVNVSETWMGGPPDVLDEPWDVTVSDRVVSFAAPDGEYLPWFTLYNFEIETDQPPVTGGFVQVEPIGEQQLEFLSISMPAPGARAIPGEIFRDRFNLED